LDQISQLIDSFRSMLSPAIAFRAGAISLEESSLFPEEIEFMSDMASKRRAEFGTARIFARELLTEIGCTPCSLIPNMDRSPFWPAGIIGSISHSDDHCVVAAVRTKKIKSVGIDIETSDPLSEEFKQLICTPEEQSWLSQFNKVEQGIYVKLIFSAKEAFYKCQYMATQRFLDFQDVTLNMDLLNKTYTISKCITCEKNTWNRIRGKFRISQNFISTVSLF